MNPASELSNILHLDIFASTSLRSLFVILSILIVTTHIIIRSYSNPGGVLHGAKNSFRSYFYARVRPRSPIQDMTDSGDDVPYSDIIFDHQPPPAVRTKFGGESTLVYGWPSTGGVWIHDNCYGVELEFLNLSRVEPAATQRWSREEDEFCKRLERIGAQFFTSEHEYVKNELFSPTLRSQLWCGWPSDGGVWFLRVESFEGVEMGVSRISNALTMGERCRTIELLGGKHYSNWEAVPKEGTPRGMGKLVSKT